MLLQLAVRCRRWSTLVVGIALIAVCAPTPRATTDLAVQQELAAGTQAVLRVIVRTAPNQQALARVAGLLTDLMSSGGVSGEPRVHADLFAVTAQIPRDRMAQVASDPAVLRISTDAVVRGAALSATDAAWTDLIAHREGLRAELNDAIKALRDKYDARIHELTSAADARHKATEKEARGRARDADLRFAQRERAAEKRADAAARLRAARDAVSDRRELEAGRRLTQRREAAVQRELNAAALRDAREAAARRREEAATAARKQAEADAPVRISAAKVVREDAVAAAEGQEESGGGTHRAGQER